MQRVGSVAPGTLGARQDPNQAIEEGYMVESCRSNKEKEGPKNASIDERCGVRKAANTVVFNSTRLKTGVGELTVGASKVRILAFL